MPLSTIEEYLALYGNEPAPQPTGETLSFFGEELAAYEVEGAFTSGPPNADSWLNCASGSSVASDLTFITASFGTEFLAETDDGPLAAGFGAFTADEAELTSAFFDEVFPTIAASQ